jgi:potassium-transporting ATPase potassium-binding subunit
MMLNVVFGGIGVGFINLIMFTILTVFLVGMMIGRTPEFLGKMIEAREMKLVTIAVLVHPYSILGFTALAALLPATLQRWAIRDRIGSARCFTAIRRAPRTTALPLQA